MRNSFIAVLLGCFLSCVTAIAVHSSATANSGSVDNQATADRFSSTHWPLKTQLSGSLGGINSCAQDSTARASSRVTLGDFSFPAPTVQTSESVMNFNRGSYAISPAYSTQDYFTFVFSVACMFIAGIVALYGISAWKRVKLLLG